MTPDAMRIRRSTVEHPFATIKAWMGSTHFLTKGLERVKVEMSLHVLAYNFRRLLTLLGLQDMLAAIRAYARIFAANRTVWSVLAAGLAENWKKVGQNYGAYKGFWISHEPYNSA